MEKSKNPSSKKAYRVVQNEGKISWRIEELWEGGVERSPYGSQEAAIRNEEIIATANGFIDDLVLQETIGEVISYTDAFSKDSAGNWHCTQGCSIEMDNKVIVFTQGMTFNKGTPHVGIDVAKWLDENS
ncbi:hypothetical protein ACFLU1_02375 [Chloroflexota bacterium]